MNKLKINVKSLLPAVALLSLSQQVNAQAGKQTSTEKQQAPVMRPFSIIEKLEPIMLTNTGTHLSTQTPKMFGFDILKLKQLFPQLIRTEAVWIQKGKNNPIAISKERVDLGQLVPILVAALQQQRTEIADLQLKLEKLQKQ